MQLQYSEPTHFGLDWSPSHEEAGAGSRRLPVFLLGAAALTVFFVPQILQLFPWMSGLQLVKATAICVGLYFLCSRRLLTDRVRLASIPQVRWTMWLLILAAATIPLSSWPSASFHFVADVYVKNVVFIYLLTQALRTDRDARFIAMVLIISATAFVLAILTGIGPLVTYKSEPGRVAVGGTYDPNDLALLFVVTLPFAFFMLRSTTGPGRKKPKTKLVLAAAIVLMLVGLVETGSRGGFLGLLAIGAMIFMRTSRERKKHALIAVALACAFFCIAAPSSYLERIRTIYNYQQDYNTTEKGGRIKVWETGLKMIVRHPLTGVGIGCFPFAHSEMTGSTLEMAPHNSFLQAGAELGIGGLLLFASIVWFSLKRARFIRLQAASANHPQFLWLASAVETSLVGFVVSGFFLSHAYSAIFCFLTAMAASLSARYRESEETEAPASREIEYV